MAFSCIAIVPSATKVAVVSAIVFAVAISAFIFASFCADPNLGIAIRANIPKIAITIISSINVKPFFFFVLPGYFPFKTPPILIIYI
ncbi:hypothetical protein Z967_07020 [Clostridium novyi A str. 4540]|nr:hypothetical protein Z967_07020 [Clostridium novyi A str. 4540]